MRRAFPKVQIVTAAIDPELHEMHLPLHNLLMGEAAGEADFVVRFVEPDSDRSESKGTEDQELGDMERLKFSRTKQEQGLAGEKRAWVVSPGTFWVL